MNLTKHFSLILILVVSNICIGQNVIKNHIITIKIKEKSFSEKYNVSFDIEDSLMINGMEKKALEKKFDKTENISTILNFMIDNGFRLINTLVLNSSSFFGSGDGSIGYLFIMEKVD